VFHSQYKTYMLLHNDMWSLHKCADMSQFKSVDAISIERSGRETAIKRRETSSLRSRGVRWYSRRKQVCGLAASIYPDSHLYCLHSPEREEPPSFFFIPARRRHSALNVMANPCRLHLDLKGFILPCNNAAMRHFLRRHLFGPTLNS